MRMSIDEAQVALENNQVDTLIFAGKYLGAQLGIKLSSSLKANKTLTSLNMRFNNLQDPGAQAVAEALAVNNTLTHLDLTNNNITEKAALKIADALAQNRTLKVLHLQINEIGSQGAIYFAKALETNRTLTYLDLSNNTIRSDGLQALANVLLINHSLSVLKLSVNLIGLENEAVPYLTNALKENKTLLDLELQGVRKYDYREEILAIDLSEITSLLNRNKKYHDMIVGSLGEFEGEYARLDYNALRTAYLEPLRRVKEHLIHEGYPKQAPAFQKIALLLDMLEPNVSVNKTTIQYVLEHFAECEEYLGTIQAFEQAKQPENLQDLQCILRPLEDAKLKLDEIFYPSQAMGYQKIATAISLLKAMVAMSGDYDELAFDRLSAIQSNYPYYDQAQEGLINLAEKRLASFESNETQTQKTERHARVLKILNAVEDSNPLKARLKNLMDLMEQSLDLKDPKKMRFN